MEQYENTHTCMIGASTNLGAYDVVLGRDAWGFARTNSKCGMVGLPDPTQSVLATVSLCSSLFTDEMASAQHQHVYWMQRTRNVHAQSLF